MIEKIKKQLKKLDWEYEENDKTISFVFGNDEITIDKRNGDISSMLGISYILSVLLDCLIEA